MVRLLTMLLLAAGMFLIGGGANEAAAQSTVRCESREYETRVCRMDTRGGVRVLNQRSSVPCRLGSTYEVRRDAVLVRNGCRADFINGYGGSTGGSGGGWGGSGGSYDRVRCESFSNRRTYCNIDTSGGVRLVRELDGSRGCSRGNSWGLEGGRLWVANYCRGLFERGSGGGGGSGSINRIDCEAFGSGRRYCTFNTSSGVRLVRELDGSRGCERGETWGTEPGRIWVSNNCRGRFERR